MSVDRRLWSVALVGTLIGLVLAGGVVGAVAVGSTSAGDRTVLAAGDALSGLTTETSTSTLVPTSSSVAPPVLAAPPSTRPVGPAPAVTTVTTRKPPAASTTATTTPPGTGPQTLEPFPDADRSFQPGRKEWSRVGGGWSVTVTVDDATPAAGQAVVFDIELSSTVEPCCGVNVLFDSAPTYQARAGDPCPAAPARPGTERFRASVVFTQPGWKRFNLTGNTGACGLDPPRIGLVGEIEVAPRPVNVQGPTLPELYLAPTWVTGHLGDRTWLAMGGDVQEYDGGTIRRVTIDWGDGSPLSEPPLTMAYSGCTVAVDGSTGSDRRSFQAQDATHHYARAGSYAVTVKAYSTACDGRSMPQTGSVSATWSTESGFGTPYG